MPITPTLEKTLLNFASYVSILGRREYSEILRKTLNLPEPERLEQLQILKATITEIFSMSPDHEDFHDFVKKYDIGADSIKDFLNFLGPDTGLAYIGEENQRVIITVPTFLKSKLDEKIYDKVSLFCKLKFGHTFWEEIEYKEYHDDVIQKLLYKIQPVSSDLAKYLYTSIYAK